MPLTCAVPGRAAEENRGYHLSSWRLSDKQGPMGEGFKLEPVAEDEGASGFLYPSRWHSDETQTIDDLFVKDNELFLTRYRDVREWGDVFFEEDVLKP